MSGYSDQVPIGSAERLIPGWGLYHRDCKESPDVADVQQHMVHQLHLHVAANVHTAHLLLIYPITIITETATPQGLDYNSYDFIPSKTSEHCLSEIFTSQQHQKQRSITP